MSREAWLAVFVLGGIVLVAGLVGAIVLAIKVFRTRQLLAELGLGGKIAFYGALIYTISPIDLLPDPIYLDDMGVLAGALLVLTRLVHKHRAGLSALGQQAWPDPRQYPAPTDRRHPQSTSGTPPTGRRTG